MVALERELPPIEAPPSADAIPLHLRRGGGSPRQVLALTLSGAIVVAVFAAGDLPRWAERFAGTPLAEPVHQATTSWRDAMDRLGLSAPHQVLREWMQRLLDRGWDER